MSLAVPHRVLIVEDDPYLGSLLLRAATERGFAAEVVRDATDALRIAEHRPPDLVVLDLGLPGDRDGRDVLCRLRGRQPVVVFTGRFDEYTVKLCRDYGALAVYPKSISVTRLFGWIDSLLRPPDATAAVA